MALLLLRVGLDVISIYNGYPKFFGRRLEHIDEMVHINHLPACFVYIAGVLELCAKMISQMSVSLGTPVRILMPCGESH